MPGTLLVPGANSLHELLNRFSRFRRPVTVTVENQTKFAEHAIFLYLVNISRARTAHAASQSSKLLMPSAGRALFDIAVFKQYPSRHQIEWNKYLKPREK